MALDAIMWALNAPVRRSGAKFVLVVLADACEPGTESCEPTAKWLAERTASDLRTIGRHLAWLEAEGWVRRRTRKYHRTIFILDTQSFPQVARLSVERQANRMRAAAKSGNVTA